MTKQEQSEKIIYGSLITSTKCYNCIHFPLCFEQKGAANLEFTRENDCCYYQPRLPENSVVLSREEYEMFVNQYKNLEIKYSNLCDNYRLCKDANETLKQNVITTRKKTVKEILQEIRGYYPIDKEHCNDGELFILNLCEDIASRYGVEVEK